MRGRHSSEAAFQRMRSLYFFFSSSFRSLLFSLKIPNSRRTCTYIYVYTVHQVYHQTFQVFGREICSLCEKIFPLEFILVCTLSTKQRVKTAIGGVSFGHIAHQLQRGQKKKKKKYKCWGDAPAIFTPTYPSLLI